MLVVLPVHKVAAFGVAVPPTEAGITVTTWVVVTELGQPDAVAVIVVVPFHPATKFTSPDAAEILLPAVKLGASKL